MIRIVTIEREYGCGGPDIAKNLAARLGWKLWDELLTSEIARLTKSAPKAVERREWRKDPVVYRIFKSFLRGAFEGSLPPTSQLQLLDAERIAKLSEHLVKVAADGVPCVIVGRDSQYFLRDRTDAFHVFLYAPREAKIRRMVSDRTPESVAIEQIEAIDRERAAFIRKHFGRDWPDHHLYDLMLNTAVGDKAVVGMILSSVDQAGAAR